jgi:inhibitor of cysteine peptidase
MSEAPLLNRLVATAIVALLVAVSVAMVLTPHSEGLPEGDLPAFTSEWQLRSYLSSRQDGRWTAALTDETAGSGNYHSTTNVQVQGVDELDMVKTNGEFIYVAGSQGVMVLKAYPTEDMAPASLINITDLIGGGPYARVMGLFLKDDMLAVVAYTIDVVDVRSDILSMNKAMTYEEMTLCCLVNVSDPYAPCILTRFQMSGGFLGSRMIGDYMYLLSERYAWSDGEVSLPVIGIDGELEEMDPRNIRFDPQAEEANAFLNILALDLKSGNGNFSTMVASFCGPLYVSHDSLYLTNLRHVRPMDDGSILDGYRPMTTIIRLSLDGLHVTPAGKGQVSGFLLNQFSLDEHQEVLRVATCTGRGDGESQVHCLDLDLDLLGSLTELAPGESIKSVRFMGPVMYLVTFLVTDPLFVIDLSDPASPQVLGELIIPGFSTYLHPCSDDLLVGLGLEDGDLKISLFNVSDPLSPEEVDTILTTAYYWSEALWEHKAVLYDDRSGSLFLPATTSDQTDRLRQLIMVVQVDEGGLTLLAELEADNWTGSARCVIIESTLYAVTGTRTTAWSLDTFERIGETAYMEDIGGWSDAPLIGVDSGAFIEA